MTAAQIESIRQQWWAAFVETRANHTRYGVDGMGRIYIQGLYGRMYVSK